MYHQTKMRNKKKMKTYKCGDCEEEKGVSKSVDNMYNCTVCKNKFSSICSLHNHILQCSLDGSYIYDNTQKMVYPLSLSCVNFEHRDQDKCDRLDEDFVDASALNNEDMSTAEKVDLVLRNVCKIFGKNKHNKKQNDLEPNVARRKRKRSNTFEEISDTNSLYDSMKNNIREKGKRNRKIPKKFKDFLDENSSIDSMNSVRSEKGMLAVVKSENESVVYKCEADTKELDGPEQGNLAVEVDNKDQVLDDAKEGNKNVISNSLENVENSENDNRNRKNKADDGNNEAESAKVEENNSKEKSLNSKKSKSQKRTKGMTKEKACPECGIVLIPSRLKKHMLSHTDERPLKCDICPKTFKSPGNLNTHKMRHSEVKPICCDKCGKGFNELSYLRRHNMVHHGVPKPFTCAICGAGFVIKYGLHRHMKRHTGETVTQCELCGMGFKSNYNLKLHIQGIHKKSPRFYCSLCDKSFMTNYQRKVHMMRHAGEKPYKCEICNVEYTERKDLRRHIRKYHTELIKENPNSLEELIDKCKTVGEIFSKQMKAMNSKETETHAPEQADFDTAVKCKTEDDSLIETDSLFESVKSEGDISSVEVLPANEYHFDHTLLANESVVN